MNRRSTIDAIATPPRAQSTPRRESAGASSSSSATSSDQVQAEDRKTIQKLQNDRKNAYSAYLRSELMLDIAEREQALLNDLVLSEKLRYLADSLVNVNMIVEEELDRSNESVIFLSNELDTIENLLQYLHPLLSELDEIPPPETILNSKSLQNIAKAMPVLNCTVEEEIDYHKLSSTDTNVASSIEIRKVVQEMKNVVQELENLDPELMELIKEKKTLDTVVKKCITAGISIQTKLKHNLDKESIQETL